MKTVKIPSNVASALKLKTEKVKSASEIDFSDLPEEKQEFVKKHKLDKDAEVYWDGIHGNIVQFPRAGRNVHRVSKDELKKVIAKLLKDPNFRWVEFSSIGF